jgi:hypothetical protein
MTAGERPAAPIGTWRAVRWEGDDSEDGAWLRVAEQVR